MHPSRNMAGIFTSLVLFLPFLLIIMCPCGSSGRELVGTENNLDVHLIQTSHKGHNHMNHMDPSLNVFFTVKDLKAGKRMPIYFPKRDPSKSPKLWPREDADSIPFSLDQLQYLLKIFSFSQGSPQAMAVEDTLRKCEIKPLKGEEKFCATSLESMHEFAQSVLGLDSDPIILTTSHKTKSSVTLQNYTMLEGIMEIQAPKNVACHTMPYPYAVYGCHSLAGANKVFRVPLVRDNGDEVEAMTVCHMDTSQFGPDHVAFKVLGGTPGNTSVCHFFSSDHLIWVPKVYANGLSSFSHVMILSRINS